MAAIDDFIADLLRNQFSANDQPVIAKVATFVAALQQINTGLSGNLFQQFSPPTAAQIAAFSIINGGAETPAPTITLQNYGGVFSSGQTKALTNNFKGAMKNVINATQWTLTALCPCTPAPANGGNGMGLFITDGTKFAGIATAQGDNLRVDQWTNSTTHFGTLYSQTDYHYSNTTGMYLRIRLSGGNLFFGWSADGRNFFEFYSNTSTLGGFFATAPTGYGVGGDERTGGGGNGPPFIITLPYWSETTP